MTETDVQQEPPAGPDAPETYRDRIATVDEQGKRRWIYPKKPRGRFTTARTVLSWFLLAVLFGAPFLKSGGEPMFLLNVLERKFILFGVIFWPQDFYLFGLVMLATVVFIFLFTAVYGRLFCGWICPQTVFMELVFRKIEYLIDGDGDDQRMLTARPWTPAKVFKRTVKHGIFFGLSFLIGNTFLAWIIGVGPLWATMTDAPSLHIGGLTAMLLFSGAFYFVFAWFREQACVLVCPYGRLQSVLLDPNSVVISYDFVRGEPRAKMRKGAERTGLGDCVDCNQCVVVCPTGIDIRNGTQLECVNCTACIDACDGVMDKVGLPRGLVRYSSYNAIKSGAARLFTPRVIAYSAVLTVLIALIAYLFIARVDLEATLLRVPGTLYQEKEHDVISNLYTLKVINKSKQARTIDMRLLEPRGTLTVVGGQTITLPDGGMAEAVAFIEIPRRNLTGVSTPVRVGIFADGVLKQTVRATLFGPAPGAHESPGTHESPGDEDHSPHDESH